MIKILADEDVPKPVIAKLRDKGVDVKSVDEDHKGITDEEVLSKARNLNRAILTFDGDYRDLKEHKGVLLVTRRARHDTVTETVYRYLENLGQEDIDNTLVNISPK